jgi:three-Cys-motif partner protein
MPTEEPVAAFDDGYTIPEVGSWTEEKHRLVSLYSTLFSSGMKSKWGKRVYIELYAGAGYSRIRNTSRIIVGSPLLALTIKDPFDKYIFCEEDPDKLKALKLRVKRSAPEADAIYFLGDCNELAQEIVAAIPRGTKDDTVLSLCFADPFDISLKFETLRILANRYVDFMVLLALYSDANRAYKRYVMEDAVKVDEFLGSKTWRERWKLEEADAVRFPRFLAQEFAERMKSVGYISTPVHLMKLVRSDERNLPLYYIALFSRNQLAYKFWDEVLKYGTDQTGFSWE